MIQDFRREQVITEVLTAIQSGCRWFTINREGEWEMVHLKRQGPGY